MPAKKYNIDHLQFTENYTPTSVYLLGLLWADGHVNKNKQDSNYGSIVFISTKPDSDYFEKILNCVGSWGFYYSTSKKHPTWKPRFTASVRNTKLVEFLCDNDYTEKSGVGADKILSKIPKSLHKYFFIGLVDGDGCFSLSNGKKLGVKFSITSSVNQDWNFVERMLNEIDVHYNIERTESETGSYSKIHVWKMSELEKLGKYLYKTIEVDKIGLPRKFEKFKLILESSRRKKTSKYKQVCKIKGGWKAYTSQSGSQKCKWLGTFDTEEAAARAAGTLVP